MRPADTTSRPAAATAPAWSEAELVELTTRLANEPAHLVNPPVPADAGLLTGANRPVPADAGLLTGANEPVPADAGLLIGANEPAPAIAGPLTGRVTDRGGDVLGSSTAPADRPWSVPLLITPEVEAWLLGWPARLVTPAHDHGRATVALTVVDGSLSEECLDPTIWTTSRRTTWRAGASTVFPPGHVHLLGAAGGRPAVAVHAWARPVGSAGRGAGRFALGRAGAAGGRAPGRGGGRTEPVEVGPGRGGDACLAGHPAHGALDLGHVRDRVAG
jgi:quercetin dioxygenase-like cupin family protein